MEELKAMRDVRTKAREQIAAMAAEKVAVEVELEQIKTALASVRTELEKWHAAYPGFVPPEPAAESVPAA